MTFNVGVAVVSARHTVLTTWKPENPVTEGVSVPAVLSHNIAAVDGTLSVLAVMLWRCVHPAGAV